MIRNWLVAGVMTLALLAGPAARAADDQAPAASYTTAEYNEFQAAVNEKDPATRVKLCEEFAAKNPSSTLLPYIHRTAALTYFTDLKNPLPAMLHADKLLAFGEKVDTLQGIELARLEMLKLRAQAFYIAFNQRQITTKEQLEQGRDGVAKGLKYLDEWKKPERLTDEQFKTEVDSDRILFNTVGGIAALQLKDYPSAIGFYKAVLVVNPKDALNTYNLGRAYLQQEPPQYMDGFWAVARAVALKIQPGEAQVRGYLKGQLVRYQNPTCDTLVEAQLNELIALAGSSAERPANFTIPSRADLDKALQERGTVDAIIAGLKGGGDSAKLTWLAACGAEFPELGGKVFEATAGADGEVILKVFTAGAEEAISAGTEPNLEVHVAGEPRAALLKKDDMIAFSATLKSFTPEPFMLVVDKAKVREDTLPAAVKAAPAKKAPAKKAPPKKAPTKRPPAKP